MKPLIIKALNLGERYCNEYINSKEDLAYLAIFRPKVRHNINLLPKKNANEKKIVRIPFHMCNEFSGIAPSD